MNCIIQNTKQLHFYKNKYLDKKLEDFFKKTTKDNLGKDANNRLNNIYLRFNAFLGLQNKKLSLLQFLNNKNTSQLISDFYSFLGQNSFPDSKNSKKYNKATLLRLITLINQQQNTNISVNVDNVFDLSNLDDLQIEYFNCWLLKDEYKTQYLNLALYYDFYGLAETRKIAQRIKQFSDSKGGIKKSKNYFGLFNLFIEKLTSKYTKFSDICYETVIKEFVREYFLSVEKKANCLSTAKKTWNNFIHMAQYVFGFSEELLLIINVGKIDGFNRHVSIKNGKQVKHKLITEIPLEICDNEAIELLLKRINQDVNLTVSWANCTLNTAYNSFLKDPLALNVDDFGYNSKELATKRLGKYDRITKEQVMNYDHNYNKIIAIASMYLLINEHPEITDSFLINCFLFNDNDDHHCLQETDNGTYLVGYKPRRGNQLAEQKILLNEKSLKVINIILEMTSKMREYLKVNKNNNYRKLFINLSVVGSKVEATKNIKQFDPKRSTGKSLIDYLTRHKNISVVDATDLTLRTSLTRLRASKGVQVYLKTESTTKMSQALGHKKYNPDLLSHYLPEPILDFFQRRWISLFQKGIICESMKDSDFLLKASGFKDMEKLDLFLKNHTLKNAPENNVLTESKSVTNNVDELYVSIDEDKIAALLSINKAVELSDSNSISTKATYWSNFANKLLNEINTNKSHISLKDIVKNAKNKVNPELFKEVIHE